MIPEGFKQVHTFTPEEQRMVEQAQQQVFETLGFIVRLHQIKGNIATTPDNHGLMEQVVPPADPAKPQLVPKILDVDTASESIYVPNGDKQR